jgi:hypothetical protein
VADARFFMERAEEDILSEHLGYEIDMVAGALSAMAASGETDWFRQMSATQ